MSVSRGVYRIAQAIKWTGRVIGVFLIFDFLWEMKPWVSEYGISQFAKLDYIAVIVLISPFVFIAITEGIAWILEGFGGD